MNSVAAGRISTSFYTIKHEPFCDPFDRSMSVSCKPATELSGGTIQTADKEAEQFRVHRLLSQSHIKNGFLLDTSDVSICLSIQELKKKQKYVDTSKVLTRTLIVS